MCNKTNLSIESVECDMKGQDNQLSPFTNNAPIYHENIAVGHIVISIKSRVIVQPYL